MRPWYEDEFLLTAAVCGWLIGAAIAISVFVTGIVASDIVAVAITGPFVGILLLMGAMFVASKVKIRISLK